MMKRITLLALALVVTLIGVQFANSAPTQIAYVPSGSGYVKVVGGVQMSSAAYPALTSDVTGTLPVANGGTGVTTSTGDGGSTVLSNKPYLTTPTIDAGVLVGGTITNATLVTPTMSTINVSDSTVTLPGSTDTLVGRSTTDTLINKTIAGASNTLSVRIGSDVTGLGSGVATALATFSSANIASACTNETGSGLLVFATSPTLTTPVMSSIVNSGTLTLPTSSDTLVGRATTDTLTNKTIDGASNTLTARIGSDVSGLGSGVATALATFSSANIASACTNETGSGALVFGTGPTLSAPVFSTISNTGTLTLPTSSDTLVGRVTTDTLQNKSFTNSTLDCSASGMTCSNFPGGSAVSTPFGPRLTASTGVCTPSSDVVSPTTIYVTPCDSGTFATYDSSTWTVHTITSDASLALSSLTSGKNYDVFVSWSGSATVSLSSAWTNDTTRADALAKQDGKDVLSSDHSKLWIGTIRTTSTTATQDTAAQRYVWNRYNRERRSLINPTESTATWDYNSATKRQANANTANKAEWVTGDALTRVDVEIWASAYSTTTGFGRVWVGIDSTSAASSQYSNEVAVTAAAAGQPAIMATYSGTPGLGYHYAAWLESGGGTNCRWVGSGGGQSGLIGRIWN